MVLNAVLMLVAATTPLAGVNEVLFSWHIVGVIVYGLLLTVGELIAKSGVTENDIIKGVSGVAILQVTYAMFGAGILSYIGFEQQVLAIGITGGITAALTLIITTYVSVRDKDFNDWNTYAGICFGGTILFSLIYTIISIQALAWLAFGCALVGFIFRLGQQVWASMSYGRHSLFYVIGVYVAAMGVFVHVLQLVVRALAEDS